MRPRVAAANGYPFVQRVEERMGIFNKGGIGVFIGFLVDLGDPLGEQGEVWPRERGPVWWGNAADGSGSSTAARPRAVIRWRDMRHRPDRGRTFS